MAKRTDIKSIMIIGAGPIIIGQACEFDYSGTQACKVLKDEGYKIILINSNPATIMTDPDIADSTYIEPITPEFVTKIIEKERPDALLPTMGGQTALNIAMKLDEMGVLEKYKVELIGANKEAIEKAEDRKKFKEIVEKIGLKCPKNTIACSLEEALDSFAYVGLPAIIRPSFTLGGSGGGIAYTKEDYINIVKAGLAASPSHSVLIDESVIGWKEYEMEVVRDKADNCIIICSIENIDPMGVHTGDSITVAPALTLTDKEYQIMRNASIAILREIGVDTGGSNVQFAINPEDGRMLVIEMNPRVSRSSALASKATGFPIAKVAAKLAVGYTLDEIVNDCTKVTPASFEPSIDYIVTKIPRFPFEKFAHTTKSLSSSMKSVGEAMAIGRNFKESLQKALCSLETNLTGLNEIILDNDEEKILEQLKIASPERIRVITQALRYNISIDTIYEITKYDKWFLHELKEIVEIENTIKNQGLKDDKEYLFHLKYNGFSNERIAELANITINEVAKLLAKHHIIPTYKRVDTCAAEFNSDTAYMYSSYESPFNSSDNECNPSNNKKVIILGSGPNRIGQGIEFDYACVHACYALKELGIETIMINCNPETVSTDYDTADKLYFEPLTDEHVLNIIKQEQSKGELLGVILQFGGQTPLKLSKTLAENNIAILGTSPDSIDLSEDRKRFKELVNKLNLKQPENYICYNEKEAILKSSSIGFPVVIRPSYVIGGRAMEIIDNIQELKLYLEKNNEFFKLGPMLIDNYLTNAIEVDVDAICDGNEVFIAGVMEHIEEAGIHSGDSACSIPPYSLSPEIINKIKDDSKKLAIALKVVGLVNIQFAIKDEIVYILEVNPRASRTVPFVAKSTGVTIAKIAAKIMLGKKLIDFNLHNKFKNIIAIKEVTFPFERFPNVDIIRGPEMRSTGESMGIDTCFELAFAKAQMGIGIKIPTGGIAFLSIKDEDKISIIPIAKELFKLGFELVATSGTANFLRRHDVTVTTVKKVKEGTPNVVDMIIGGEINLIINTTKTKQAMIDNSSIRRTALMKKVLCITALSSAKPLIAAIKKIKQNCKFEVKSLQDYLN